MLLLPYNHAAPYTRVVHVCISNLFFPGENMRFLNIKQWSVLYVVAALTIFFALTKCGSNSGTSYTGTAAASKF
jgi:hypothetical protein